MNNKMFKELLKERIIVIDKDIDNELANLVVAQLLFLYENSKEKDIYLIINSLGGEITSGFAIYDTMKYFQCDINTICLNISASMATILLSSGTKGKRYCIKNSIINPSLRMSCDEKGIEHILGEGSKRAISLKEKIISIMSDNTGIEMEKIRLICEMDNMLDPIVAKKCGLIDIILDVNEKDKNKSGIRRFLLFKDDYENNYYRNIIKDLKSVGVFN